MIKSYARASALLSLEAGIAKHCLGQIVDIAKIKLNKGIALRQRCLTSLQVRTWLHAPHHLVTFAIDAMLTEINHCHNFHIVLGKVSFQRDPQSTRHVHYAPQQAKSCTIE